MNAVRVHQPGGPEAMRYEEVARPVPGPGEALVKIAAAGVNFVDVYFRTGMYKAELPVTLGQEAAGAVEAVGPGVTEVAVGDRVAYASIQGSYAEYALVPSERLVPVPHGVDDRTAAAVMLQGMTAHYLASSTYPVRHGDTCLVHAAAGGVGLLLSQIVAMRGARVIGTVSTEEKAALAREAGAHEIILYTRSDFVAETKRLTDGRGVSVVYDSVGKSTFEGGLDALRPRGMMVLFGQSSGPVPAIDPQVLNRKGSLFLTRPSLVHYIAERNELLVRANELFAWVWNGHLRVRIDRELPLRHAAEAHRLLESRQTTGKVLLIP